MRKRLLGLASALAVACTLAMTGCVAPAPEPKPVASVDDPQLLSDTQAEALSAMRFKNYASGVVGFTSQLFTRENGDMLFAGWVDFTGHRGYARVAPPAAAPIYVVWDEERLAYLDFAGDEAAAPMPALPPPAGEWQLGELEPATGSELTRMLAAILLLSHDRPENPLLVKQNGARYLGAEEVDGVAVDRYSGVSVGEDGQGEPDLGTQYWLDADGDLVRFGLRTDGSTLSTVTFERDRTDAPESLPSPSELGAPSGAAADADDESGGADGS